MTSLRSGPASMRACMLVESVGMHVLPSWVLKCM